VRELIHKKKTVIHIGKKEETGFLLEEGDSQTHNGGESRGRET
jgi:hypothetical protein